MIFEKVAMWFVAALSKPKKLRSCSLKRYGHLMLASGKCHRNPICIVGHEEAGNKLHGIFWEFTKKERIEEGTRPQKERYVERRIQVALNQRSIRILSSLKPHNSIRSTFDFFENMSDEIDDVVITLRCSCWKLYSRLTSTCMLCQTQNITIIS